MNPAVVISLIQQRDFSIDRDVLMKKTCASCNWFFTDDEDGHCYCTVNPPDYKGRYPRITPDSCCKDYESTEAVSYETKDERNRYVY